MFLRNVAASFSVSAVGLFKTVKALDLDSMSKSKRASSSDPVEEKIEIQRCDVTRTP